ncbi:glutamine-rich protein 2-like isoform X6 [Mytilus californianus]|uniref:glutamine-rich protein 2-like isoform X6 n=1 Tax=Mytilus californianus TaxID=6549 RepID=UPI002248377A|nr:glutamine-rich protein 2-like isoform X6 [Mytilus californianus]
MPSTKVNLSQMVDLALGSPEVGSVNFNVLHTLLHAMLKRLNIVDVQADINEFDRDFLSASKARELSVLSDVDSGRGEDTEDTLSERSSAMPTPSTGRKTPYHHLEVKVAKLQEQLDNITSVPSNQDLFEKTKTQYAEKPIGEMWMNMQLMSRVETNEKGIAKCMSMIEDMMKEMQSLKDANKSLMDKVKGLNLDDLMKRLKDLESKMNDVNDRFNLLPSPDDFAQFVTWAGLEDALSGIKKDWENMQQPTERVVIEMSSQTEAKRQFKPSRPASSRPGTRMSSGSTGPSETLLEILEKLGRLSESHDSLTKRVEILEEEIKNKLDKGALDNLNVSSDLLEQLQQLKQEVDALAAAREKDININEDSDALGRAQAAIQQLQAEVEKLHGTTKDILEENASRAKEIEKLFAYCDRLEENKADKEFVQSEMDVKADKRSLDNKVNHSLFDTTTNDINKMIKEILDKLAGNEEAWNHQCKVFTDDIEGKLDRLELDPLKEWLESRLKALNEKLKKQNQAPVEWSEDDAAGIRRQLIQKFHCISCDRPVDIVPTGPVPSLPTHNGLHPTRSPRPYTTFELDQIRQHAKRSKMSPTLKRMYAGIDRPGSRYANSEIADYYATTRSCGGQHTTTFPQKRITKLSHLSHLFREEEQSTNIYPLYKEEVDVQGADGNIYKGRMGRIEAKLPVMTKERSIVQRIDKSPQPMRQQITRVVRPVSAKHSPRPPSSKGGSRPQSAHPSASQHEVPANESSHTTPAPSQSPVPPEDIPQQQSIEIPAES